MAMITVEQAIIRVRAGQLVAMPTETVYGLAGDARRAATVAEIFSHKRRPSFDPLIVHVASLADGEHYAHFTPLARQLAAAFWPGPLTLVLPRRPGIADLVTSGLETVGVRCPDHPIALELLQASGCPLAAPSANLFGRISPTSAAAVFEQFADEIPIVDGGPCRVGVESTVLFMGETPRILRPGGLTPEQLAAVVGAPVALATRQEKANTLPQLAPGLLASHYAPCKPLRMLEDIPAQGLSPTVGLVSFRGQPDHPGPQEILSPSGDLAEAATKVFAALRTLDNGPAQTLVAQWVPNHGLGLAINDRLRRAAGLG